MKTPQSPDKRVDAHRQWSRRLLRGFGTTVIAVLVFTLHSGNTQAAVIFDNFDSGGGFHPEFNTVAASVVRILDEDEARFVRAAAQFTVSGGDFNLSSVTLPISFQGALLGDDLRVRLTADSGGAPGATLEVLSENQDIWPGFASPFTTTTTLISASTPLLSDGVSYWIVTEPTSVPPPIGFPFQDYRWFQNTSGAVVPFRFQQTTGGLPSDPWTGSSVFNAVAFLVEGTKFVDEDSDGVPDNLDLCPGTVGSGADSNGCSDAQVDGDADGICNLGAPSAGPSACTGTDICPVDFNPLQEDLDGDGLGDACDPDVDGDGVADDVDAFPDDPAASVDTDDDGMPDDYNAGATPEQIAASALVVDSDDDDDGMLDECELAAGLDPKDPLDAGRDEDADGLSNLEECELGTDVNNPDTDGDGISDGEEVARGTNPLVDDSDIISLVIPILAAVASRPDLEVINPGATPTSVTEVQNVTLSATVTNQGGDAPSTTELHWLLSSDSSIVNDADTEIGTATVVALQAGATQDEELVGTLPAGTWWVGACVDALSGELNTANQCSPGVQVTVSPSPPDLVVIDATASPRSVKQGIGITLSARVRNQGDGGSSATTLRWTWSNGEFIESAVGPLGPGDTSVKKEVSFDSSLLPIGQPSVEACVDVVSGESNTANQCSSGGSVTISRSSPDLVVINPTARPPSVEQGADITLSANVRNRGDGGSSATTLRWTWPNGEFIETAVGPLGPGDTSVKKRVLFDSGLLPFGQTSVEACVDAVSGESNTANQCSSGDLVTVEEPSDPAP